MGKESLIILLGILVVLTPFLGFPHTWEMILSIVIGLGIVAVGVFSRLGGRQLLGKTKRRENGAFEKSNVPHVSSHRGNISGVVERDSHDQKTTTN